MAEDATFGCGTFLPGHGPGNFDDFDGGGTIDGGGGRGGPRWTDWDQVTGHDQPTGPGGTLQSTNGGGTGAKALLSAAEYSGEFDLNNPTIASLILKQKPAGIEEPDIAFITAPPPPNLVNNNSRITELFNDKIDSNIEYILAHQPNPGNWDSTKASGVTYSSVFMSLKPEIKDLLSQIRNYDGTPLTTNQIFSMIGSRILDGTISNVTKSSLLELAKSSKERNPVAITRSNSTKVNEVTALALIDRDKFTLDPAKADGVMKNILPNWKTLSSDIDRYIEVTVGKEIKKYYIKDDNTFIGRSSLALEDGDYFDITKGSVIFRLFAKSEIDHAYLIPEQTRQRTISLLGGTPGRTLQVSSNILDGIEFDYSLTAPRQDFYMLSCVLSSIDTTPSLIGSFLLKDSVVRYELIDTTTTDSLKTCNDFIKYKANHRVFILDDEDVMLDYIQSTSSLTLKQTDILADSPKTNKTIPLLTRQIPWYIMVYPTNRSSLNIFNTKSEVVNLKAPGPVIRELKCNTSIVPNFSQRLTNKFVRFQLQGLSGMDVFGKTNLQTRITKVTSSDTVFKTGYKQDDQLISAAEYTPSRQKTGVRLLKEIITELNTNYLLGLDGIGKSLTEFDVFSRLTLKQFNILSRLENFETIRNSIRDGVFEEVKVIPPIHRANSRISFQKTQLVRRKVRVEDDTFTSIKGMKDNQIIIPPTTTGPATFGPVPG